jgi:hypothetical protein
MMRVEFYQLIQDEASSVDLAEIPGTAFDASHETVRQTTEAHFAELMNATPEIRNIIVLSPNIGEPPGAIIAVELVRSVPAHERARPETPARELIWVTDLAVGLR